MIGMGLAADLVVSGGYWLMIGWSSVGFTGYCLVVDGC